MKNELIFEILGFSLIPLAAMLAGAVAAVLFSISNKIRSLILHLAAGVVFAVVSIELLPIVVSKNNLVGTSVGFFAGLGLMLLIKHFSHKAEEKHKAALKSNAGTVLKSLIPWALLIGIGVDIFIDGILLGVGFAAGQSEGMLLCIALSLEILVLGIVVATELKNEQLKKRKIIYLVAILSSSFVVGAFVGSIMLSILSENSITYVLAFGLSALMYLVTEELLVEAHEHKDTPLNTAVFFIGFFIFLIVAIIH
ncbi:MAG TPA: transporter [Bacteroidales bacterium]|nr:transporter [Bacteroidales bacterium]